MPENIVSQEPPYKGPKYLAPPELSVFEGVPLSPTCGEVQTFLHVSASEAVPNELVQHLTAIHGLYKPELIEQLIETWNKSDAQFRRSMATITIRLLSDQLSTRKEELFDDMAKARRMRMLQAGFTLLGVERMQEDPHFQIDMGGPDRT